MATLKGTDGAVKYIGTRGSSATVDEIAGIDTWELTVNVDSDEVSDYQGGRDKEFLQTTVGWTGTISGSYHTTGPMQTFIDNLSSTGGGPSNVWLMLEGSTADKYIGQFNVDSIANTGSLGTKRSFSASITATAGVKRTSST